MRQGKSLDSRLAGSAGGYFCPACSVVVLDRKPFNDYVAASPDIRAGSFYMVPGLLDLSAVPEGKRDSPFDEVDNPLPLVMFSNRQQRPWTLRS